MDNVLNHSQFIIGGPIGKGGFGTVFTGTLAVAVKKIDYIDLNQFQTELTLLTNLRHPNIVQVFGRCSGPCLCLIMEHADGGNLHNYIHNNPFYQQVLMSTKLNLVQQLAQGLAYLHQQNVVHRDLKPANLLLFNCQSPPWCGLVLKIADFGVSRDAKLVMTAGVGTFCYMAPEVRQISIGQLHNIYTYQCDVYSFGIIFWEVLSCTPPYFIFSGTPIQRNLQNMLNTVSAMNYTPMLKAIAGTILIRCCELQFNLRPSAAWLANELLNLRNMCYS